MIRKNLLLFFSLNTNILMSETICVYLFTIFNISLTTVSDMHLLLKYSVTRLLSVLLTVSTYRGGSTNKS